MILIVRSLHTGYSVLEQGHGALEPGTLQPLQFGKGPKQNANVLA